MVIILTEVAIKVMLETNSGSVSNSIAYIVVVAAVSIADTIISTVPNRGSILNIVTNRYAKIGAPTIFSVTLEAITCQFNFKDVIDPSCIPSTTIMTGIAASPTTEIVEWIESVIGICKY